jgi:hypothetical protein
MISMNIKGLVDETAHSEYGLFIRSDMAEIKSEIYNSRRHELQVIYCCLVTKKDTTIEFWLGGVSNKYNSSFRIKVIHPMDI